MVEAHPVVAAAGARRSGKVKESSTRGGWSSGSGGLSEDLVGWEAREERWIERRRTTEQHKHRQTGRQTNSSVVLW